MLSTSYLKLYYNDGGSYFLLVDYGLSIKLQVQELDCFVKYYGVVNALIHMEMKNYIKRIKRHGKHRLTSFQRSLLSLISNTCAHD
ncbi:hypothetical protein CMV_014504 [Castanea mollissima]|uniref:Uncharacterized protein n=1 Tax=Castanea mollissima TaxID=60419 RepID=A0A8J4RC04_9ROSI|nr:hypothetical protein CMV_014504 [Castanea mollissima]